MQGQTLPVIVTRAEPGASETAARLGAFDVEVIVAPMLALEVDLECPIPDLGEISGLVFTSANGVRVFANRTSDRSLTAWCVGPATAEAARDSGFADVRESSGNAVDLALYIDHHAASSNRPLLHVANAAAKGDLKVQLEALGRSVEFAPLYTMRPASALPEPVQHAIQSASACLVLIHSAKGAARFASLCAEQSVSHLVAIAISEPASQPLLNLDLKAIHIASAPNEAKLLSALSAAIATLSA
ncbi:MAG: uroporphyrinogen-III synthase [Pseudomonadota bacterium]